MLHFEVGRVSLDDPECEPAALIRQPDAKSQVEESPGSNSSDSFKDLRDRATIAGLQNLLVSHGAGKLFPNNLLLNCFCAQKLLWALVQAIGRAPDWCSSAGDLKQITSMWPCLSFPSCTLRVTPLFGREKAGFQDTEMWWPRQRDAGCCRLLVASLH